MDLARLLYVSTATEPMDSTGLRELLSVSQRNNAALEVTGLLIYSGGHFMQLLEGPVAHVRDLFKTITHDPRHERVIRVMFGPTEQRVFASWSMAVMNLEQVRRVQYRRLREIVESGATLDGGRTALELLHEFALQMMKESPRPIALMV